MATFRYANQAEREQILQSEKKIFGFRIVCMVVFFLIYLVICTTMLAKTKSAGSTASRSDADYLAGFAQTRETIVRELYGDSAEYAESKLYQNKSDFLDKEKTRETGEMTYDEAAMENYRREMIAEFESQIDYKQVDALLAERQAAYLAAAKDSDRAGTDVNGQGRRGNLAIFILLPLYLAAVYLYWIKRYLAICRNDFEVVEASITNKEFLRRGEMIYAIKRRATASYEGGTAPVNLTYAQAISLPVGTPVYLIRLDNRLVPYAICER